MRPTGRPSRAGCSPIWGARYHPLIASLADTGELLHTRLRGGNAAPGRGAASFVAETLARMRHAGARGGLTLRADSGSHAGLSDRRLLAGQAVGDERLGQLADLGGRDRPAHDVAGEDVDDDEQLVVGTAFGGASLVMSQL